MSPFLSPPFIISILIALSVHEWSHGFVAHKLGDPTAESEGRLTLNPIAHLDPLGTIMFLIIGFGWGKPVPINPSYFQKPRRDTALTALAGPASNFILAWIAFLVLLFLTGGKSATSALGLLEISNGQNPVQLAFIQIAASSLFINLALMAFNLLPIAPLDGSKIVRPFIPYQHQDSYEEFMRRGPFILLILIILGRLVNLPILSGWVFGIMTPILIVMELVGSLVF